MIKRCCCWCEYNSVFRVWLRGRCIPIRRVIKTFKPTTTKSAHETNCENYMHSIKAYQTRLLYLPLTAKGFEGGEMCILCSCMHHKICLALFNIRNRRHPQMSLLYYLPHPSLSLWQPFCSMPSSKTALEPDSWSF
jgi:hypothetical protein